MLSSDESQIPNEANLPETAGCTLVRVYQLQTPFPRH